MAKITDLPEANDLDGSEAVPIVKGGVTRRATLGGVVAAVATPFVLQAEAAAAVAEGFSGKTYDSLAEGEAATPPGQAFAARNADETISIYLRTPEGSVLQRTIVSGEALAGEEGASRLGYRASPSAAKRHAGARLRDHYTLADYVESSESEAHMAQATARLFNDAGRANVQVDLNNYDWTLSSDLVLPPSKRAIFHGYGSVNSAGGSIVRNVHDKISIFQGFTARGSNPLFKFTAAPSESASIDFEIGNMIFQMDPGVWALMMSGAREGTVHKSKFRSGRGIYRTLSNVLTVSESHFLGLDFAIFSDGQKSAFSCALNLDKTMILGCGRSLVQYGDDDGSITNCTIDYNDDGMRFLGQDREKVLGGYLGNRKSQRSLPAVVSGDGTILAPAIAIGDINPGVVIAGGNGDQSQKIKFIGVIGTGHVTEAGYDIVYVEDARNVLILGGSLAFYTGSAVRWGANVTGLKIYHNDTAPRVGSAATHVFKADGPDDGSNQIHGNTVTPGQLIAAPFASIQSNPGYLTSNRGEAVVASGVSTFTVAHGLPFTPNKRDIILTPGNRHAAACAPYVVSIDATNITIGFDINTTAAAGVIWHASKQSFSG